MRIESAIIGMDSARSYSSRTEQKSSVIFTVLNAQEEVMKTDNETINENKIVTLCSSYRYFAKRNHPWFC